MDLSSIFFIYFFYFFSKMSNNFGLKYRKGSVCVSVCVCVCMSGLQTFALDQQC